MNKEIQSHLVDLYAGNELTEELRAKLEEAAYADPDLRHDMISLKTTVELLHSDRGAELSDEAHQRIQLRMQIMGAYTPPSAEAAYWQYQLPIHS